MAATKKGSKARASRVIERSKDDVVTIDIQPFLIPLSILLGAVIISASIIIGLNNASAGASDVAGITDTTAGAEAADDTAQAVEFQEVSTTIDNDAYLGDKDKAKVAIVEFSDYECPFCKRHFEQTQRQIEENFVDTGEAIYVFRDFPLYFHEPNATEQAMAAECIKDQAGNKAYFEFHDLILKTTTSNKGLAKDKLYELAKEIGVDSGKFADCLDNEKFKDEVAKDTEAGQAAGVSGTPGFVIGVLKDDGTVEGKRIDGAFPYAQFEELIKEMLAKVG